MHSGWCTRAESPVIGLPSYNLRQQTDRLGYLSACLTSSRPCPLVTPQVPTEARQNAPWAPEAHRSAPPLTATQTRSSCSVMIHMQDKGNITQPSENHLGRPPSHRRRGRNPVPNCQPPPAQRGASSAKCPWRRKQLSRAAQASRRACPSAPTPDGASAPADAKKGPSATDAVRRTLGPPSGLGYIYDGPDPVTPIQGGRGDDVTRLWVNCYRRPQCRLGFQVDGGPSDAELVALLFAWTQRREV